MILETAVSSLILEAIRPYFNRVFKKKNNRQAISKMKKDMPTFQTVGELRTLLDAFTDNTPVMSSGYEYTHIQIIDWLDEGRICFGGSSHLSEDLGR